MKSKTMLVIKINCLFLFYASSFFAQPFTRIWEQWSDPSGATDKAYDNAVDGSGIYIVGYDDSPGNNQWRIEKRNLTNGAFVAGFGTGGVITNNPSASDDIARSIAIDANYMYVAGIDKSPSNNQWRIEKRDLTTGALVAGFGTGGVVTYNPSTRNDDCQGIAIDATGIYVVGWDYVSSSTNSKWRIVKYDFTGTEVFNQTSNPSASRDYAYKVAVDATGLYIVGMQNNSASCRIEKRDLITGNLITAFDGDGIITVSPGTSITSLYNITVDDTYIYVIGYDRNGASYEWYYEKRNKNNGNLIFSQPADQDVGSDYGWGIAVVGDYLYGVGTNNGTWRFEQRDKSGGWLSCNTPYIYPGSPYSIASDGTGIYVVGYGGGNWILTKYDFCGDTPPLPINLLSFDGSNTGYYNNINWSTASETNNDYFTLERGADTLSFITVTVVDGAGNSNTTLNYEYTDKLQTIARSEEVIERSRNAEVSNFKPQNVFYYRLKQTDFDGNFTYSKIITVEQNSSNSGITLISNPTCSNIELFVNSETDDTFHIEIIDIVGRTMSIMDNYVSKGRNKIQLNTENLKNAVYFIYFRTNKGVEYVNKFVK